jgi:hypothetical protein
MPMVMIERRGRYCPTIVCEVCREPITESGNVLYDPERLDALYWFLVYLANNAQLPPRTLVEKEAWIKHVGL